MPNPTRGDVHVNRPLTNISIAYMQQATDFIAARVFPNIPVNNKSDLYFLYDRGDFNRDEMQERAPATESAGAGYTVSTDNYSARVYAFHKDIDDQTRSNTDAPLNMDRDATEFVTQKALIKREKLWVSKFFTTSKWTTDITGSSATPASGEALQWNDASSTPLEDVADGITTIKQSTGYKPNVLVLGFEVWQKLKNHPDIVDRIKYSGGVSPTSPAIVTRSAVAALMEIDSIEIMQSVENTANRGLTASHSFIGGKHALLAYSNPRPSIMTPSAGYTFSWRGFMGAGAEGGRIKRFRMEEIESDRVEIQMAFDQKLVAADLGYFFSGIVA